MQFHKISCINCHHCDKCSKQTRMYVNYCGSDRARIMDRIRRAERECSNRQGLTLNVRTPVPAMA